VGANPKSSVSLPHARLVVRACKVNNLKRPGHIRELLELVLNRPVNATSPLTSTNNKQRPEIGIKPKGFASEHRPRQN
jgi:hypothetical protein